MARVMGLPTNGTNPGGAKWELFFAAAGRFGDDPTTSQVSELRSLWGTAEDVSTYRGVRVAENIHGLSPTEKEEFLFLTVGDFYRGALIDPGSAATELGLLSAATCGGDPTGYASAICAQNLVNDFYEDIDPRNRTATYENAMAFWNQTPWLDDVLEFFIS